MTFCGMPFFVVCYCGMLYSAARVANLYVSVYAMFSHSMFVDWPAMTIPKAGHLRLRIQGTLWPIAGPQHPFSTVSRAFLS